VVTWSHIHICKHKHTRARTHTHTHTHTHTREFNYNPKSKKLDPDRPQIRYTDAWVITQRYSSVTFVSLLFLSRKEKSVLRCKKFTCVKIASRKIVCIPYSILNPFKISEFRCLRKTMEIFRRITDFRTKLPLNRTKSDNTANKRNVHAVAIDTVRQNPNLFTLRYALLTCNLCLTLPPSWEAVHFQA